jgi:polycystin 1
MRVWSDSSGLGEMSAWYLMSLQVMDIQTGQVTLFVADQWLAIDRGTFEDDISIPSSGHGDQFTRDFLIKSGITHKFSDDHIWWSVFSRPTRSRFTRYAVTNYLINLINQLKINFGILKSNNRFFSR